MAEEACFRDEIYPFPGQTRKEVLADSVSGGGGTRRAGPSPSVRRSQGRVPVAMRERTRMHRTACRQVTEGPSVLGLVAAVSCLPGRALRAQTKSRKGIRLGDAPGDGGRYLCAWRVCVGTT